MTFDEIVERCSKIRVNEKRVTKPDYVEWVVFAEDLPQWDIILSDLFGGVAKPQGQKTTAEDFALTEKFGGIYDDQTLYRCTLDDGIVLAMIWPWQNKVFATIKFALVPPP